MSVYFNKVTQQGKIISVNHKEGSTISSITLETTVSRDQSNRNRLTIMFFGEMYTEALKYNAGDFVTVSGTLQSHESKNLSGKTSIKQDVVATKIEPTRSRMELLINNYKSISKMYDKSNDVIIAGDIVSIYEQTDKIKLIGVKTYANDSIQTVSVTIYQQPYNSEFFDSLTIGDNIIVIGTIQTKLKKTENKSFIYENFIGMEFATIDDSTIIKM